MAYNEEKSKQLYNKLLDMGFDEGLCELISKQLCTDWTADRMLGYLNYVPHLREQDVVDEMLAILSDRDRITAKHEMEYYQSKINEIYEYGLGTEDD